MKLGWLSDIHLNFLAADAITAFVAELAGRDVDAWLISGDLADARSVVPCLRLFADRPTYFVLGNHDFYHGAFAPTKERVRAVVGRADRLVWLTEADAQFPTDDLAIVGDDGWGDARFGNAATTPVELNDFRLIEDLAGLSRAELVRVLQRLGDESAARLAPKLTAAALARPQVLVVTHVPPFWEASWHEGVPSDPDWVPWFACRATGEVILERAREHPATQFTVLCGHTHGEGVWQAAPNVTVHTAGARYGAPCVQRVVGVGASGRIKMW